MNLHYLPEITGGVLLARLGEVHRWSDARATDCGRSIPDRHAPVSHVQAVVHKLRLCHTCYPAHNRHGGPNAR